MGSVSRCAHASACRQRPLASASPVHGRPLGWLFALAAIGPALYDALPSCAGARKAARKAAMPLLGGTKPAEVPPEPVPESVLNTIEWTKGYGHIISGHPHCGVLTNDGGVMIVGDCANYYQDENGGGVQHGQALAALAHSSHPGHKGVERWRRGVELPVRQRGRP